MLLYLGLSKTSNYTAHQKKYDSISNNLSHQRNENSQNNQQMIPTLQYGVGINGLTLSITSLIDSGLLILSNWKPKDCGFIKYIDYPLKDEEILANKGILWAFTALVIQNIRTIRESHFLVIHKIFKILIFFGKILESNVPFGIFTCLMEKRL